MCQTFIPSFNHLKLFMIFLGTLISVFILIGIIQKSYFICLVCLILPIYWIAVKFIRRIKLTDNEIIFNGIIIKWKFNLKDIIKVKRMHDYGYPFDRFYNYRTYKIFTKSNNTRKISFFFFHGSSEKEILNAINKHKSL